MKEWQSKWCLRKVGPIPETTSRNLFRFLYTYAASPLTRWLVRNVTSLLSSPDKQSTLIWTRELGNNFCTANSSNRLRQNTTLVIHIVLLTHCKAIYSMTICSRWRIQQQPSARYILKWTWTDMLSWCDTIFWHPIHWWSRRYPTDVVRAPGTYFLLLSSAFTQECIRSSLSWCRTHLWQSRIFI